MHDDELVIRLGLAYFDCDYVDMAESVPENIIISILVKQLP
jgi:hypothetical protein